MPAPHPNTILTRAEVAGWLKLKPRQVERLGIPCLDLGRRTKRYSAEDVLLWLRAKRTERARPQVRMRASAFSFQQGHTGRQGVLNAAGGAAD